MTTDYPKYSGLVQARPQGAFRGRHPYCGELVLSNNDPLLERYRFGTGITEFWICRRCGVYVAVTMDGLGALNVRSLRPIPSDLREPIPMQYGQDSIEDKRKRRAARWTPLASIEP